MNQQWVHITLWVFLLVFYHSTIMADDAMNFQHLDRNDNGFISKQEARQQQELYQQWLQVDRNRDGMLSEVEFSIFESESVNGVFIDASSEEFAIPPCPEDFGQ